MAKIKLKLPRTWLYKLKGVPKSGEQLVEYNSGHGVAISKQESSALASLKKGNYASPVNHKAIDITFPSDTPKKSPVSSSMSGLPFSEDLAILSPLDPSEISAAPVWPFLKIGNKGNQPVGCIKMGSYGEDDGILSFSPAFQNKSGPLSNGPNFDVRELERRLKALASEDRRRYYASPMLSEVLPTPTHDVVVGGVPHSPLRQNIDSSMHASEGANNVTRRLPLNVVYEDGSYGGEALYRSSSIDTNSIRRSTSSSSDTGYEKGTSSIWERDILSITSDGSEALMMSTMDEGAEANQGCKSERSRHHRNPRVRVASAQSSPSLHKSNGKSQNGDISSEHYDESSVHVHKGARRSLFWGSPCQRQKSVTSQQRDLHYADVNGRNDFTDNETTWDGWQASESTAHRSPSKASPCHSTMSGHGQHLVMDLPDRFVPDKHHQGGGKQSPLPEYKLPLSPYEYGEPNKLASTYNRKSLLVHGDQFSYTACKERFLSGRTSFEQGGDMGALHEGEAEYMPIMSNYIKYKLKHRIQTNGKVGIKGSSSPKLGLHDRYYSPANDPTDRIEALSASATTMSDSYHYGTFQGSPEHHIRSHSHRSSSTQRYPFLHHSIALPVNMSKGLSEDSASPNLCVQGPTWSNKATLSAVREKIGDPSFQRFRRNANAPDTPPQSRVFDSIAKVKSSYDLKQDFKDSMLEMIMEKDLNSSHDMVELLQCYLTLNPPRYHDTIVKVFTEVWCEVFEGV